MKKILFVVCTHGNEVAGFNLFINHPYGQVGAVFWEVIIGNPQALALNLRFTETDLNRSFNTKNASSYEEKRAEILKKRFQNYDVIYDIHTTQVIKSPELDDCIFINTVNAETMQECSFVSAPHIIWDSDTQYQKQYLTAHHPIGITLEYQKTADYFHDVNRIRNDFYNIIHQEKSSVQPKQLYEAARPITQKEKELYQLDLIDFKPLTVQEKKLLQLSQNEDYVPVFINTKDIDEKYYCFLNKKITDVNGESL